MRAAAGLGGDGVPLLVTAPSGFARLRLRTELCELPGSPRQRGGARREAAFQNCLKSQSP